MSKTDPVKSEKKSASRPWLWIPSLYFAEGIPYVMVMTLSVIFYKRMGVSNTDIALYTSWLYLPWVIKPLWGPVVDILRTKRFWILVMQLCIGAGLAGVAFTIPVDRFFQFTLAFFWLLAFSSATHDIAADGFYMLGLSKGDQAFFVGIRSTFYRLAMLTGQGLLVILAGYFEAKTGLPEVEVNVMAVEEVTSAVFNPEAISVKLEGEGACFITSEEVRIGTARITEAEANTLLADVDGWNSSHGFYPAEEDAGEASAADTDGTIAVGNVGYTWFRLNTRPEEGENIVLNFSFDKGDKSIALARSYRFEFNEENWDVPAFAVFKLDPKLEKATSASFSGLSGNIRFAWTMVFVVVALLFAGFHIYHRFALPRPAADQPNLSGEGGFMREFLVTFAEFFKKKRIGVMLVFLLVYRLGESQLVKLASPFLLDSREASGLGLTTGDLGLIYGTIGIIALSLGGIIGGIAASRRGLKYWLWWMVAAMNLPNLVYVFLSYTMPSSLWVVGASVAVEQFGYGFGFTAYMLYMIYVSEGRHKTAHFALTTGFMALGMMIPGMISGWLQELIGYQHFFIWVMFCTIPSFLVIPFLKIDPGFGKRES
ncbi:MAG: AmpG family muropeptide MFS transporter [Bacteroidetes bacterium]|nr:AmpG family muropeptide MFS transporter [Bacteroidota bacterium]